jgi:hypothetical protein
MQMSFSICDYRDDMIVYDVLVYGVCIGKISNLTFSQHYSMLLEMWTGRYVDQLTDEGMDWGILIERAYKWVIRILSKQRGIPATKQNDIISDGKEADRKGQIFKFLIENGLGEAYRNKVSGRVMCGIPVTEYSIGIVAKLLWLLEDIEEVSYEQGHTSIGFSTRYGTTRIDCDDWLVLDIERHKFWGYTDLDFYHNYTANREDV